MPVITLLTDFGLRDEYVGVMKGVICSIHTGARVLDITHGIDPQDITEAAYILNAAYPHFPDGTIHVVVVDPGVGGSRKIIALMHRTFTFLAPDNGVLSLIQETGEIEAAYQVENSEFFLKSISNTFHGRDIFAPVAAHLAKGVPLEALGRPISPSELIVAHIPKPRINGGGELIGTIISVDRFGNLVTNVGTELLEKLGCRKRDRRLSITVGGHEIVGLSNAYDMSAPGEPMAIIGSRMLLEISISMGSAEQRLNCRKGDELRVSVG